MKSFKDIRTNCLIFIFMISKVKSIEFIATTFEFHNEKSMHGTNDASSFYYCVSVTTSVCVLMHIILSKIRIRHRTRTIQIRDLCIRCLKVDYKRYDAGETEVFHSLYMKC